jgi:hypothetical protein
MQAFAWDVETNTRNATIFIVPHKRDKRGGPEKLVDMRDVYENNANAGARRVRECIFGVLPPWYVEKAKKLCTETIEKGVGDKPLPERIAAAIGLFEGLGVSVEQIERKLERPSSRWNAHDVAQLRVIYQSLQSGEITRDEEFPPVRVTASEIAGAPAAAPAPAEDGQGLLPSDPDLAAAEPGQDR